MTLAGTPSGSLPGEGLGQEHRRAQIDVEMHPPALGIQRIRAIPLEAGGVVDEAGGGPKRLAAGLDQGREVIEAGEIGLQGRGLTAHGLDFVDEARRRRRGGVIMDPDPPATGRQIERNGPAEAAPRAGHEHGRVSVVVEPWLPCEERCRIELSSVSHWRNGTLGDRLNPNKAQRAAAQMR